VQGGAGALEQGDEVICHGSHPPGVGEIAVEHQPDGLIHSELRQQADQIRLAGQVVGQHREPEAGFGGGELGRQGAGLHPAGAAAQHAGHPSGGGQVALGFVPADEVILIEAGGIHPQGGIIP